MTPPFLSSPPGADPLVVEGAFRASPDRVFRAWTDPNQILKWFGPGPATLETARIDLRVGGRWRFEYALQDGCRDVLTGEYTAVEPFRRLAFSWTHERTLSGGRTETTPASHVTLHLEETEDGVLLRLLHEAIRTEDGRLGVGRGWDGSLARLRPLVEDADG